MRDIRFERRHFEAIAATLQEVVSFCREHDGPQIAGYMVDRFADLGERANPAFDRERFITACLPFNGHDHAKAARS